jgi:flagellar basal-body rod protein FlgG
MDASMWIAKTGLDAQQTRMAVISNNLANVNTTGFKRDRATFEDMLYQNVRQPGAQLSANAQAPTGLMLGTGVRLVATEKTHVQGSLVQTKGALDLAIQGEGFFQVTQADNSIAYTRDGAFKKSATGQVVTATGQPLFPPILIPQNAASITVSQDGIVSVELAGGAGAQQIGQLTIARFNNPSGLQAMGQNLLRETPASGAPQVLATPVLPAPAPSLQGAVEASNVNVVEEMVNMIETQRAYEINSKAISAVDGMLKFLNNNL